MTFFVSAGAEGFELECGPWNCLGNRALIQDSYIPDFDAVGVAPLRVLRIRRPAFLACMEATSLQPVVSYQVISFLASRHASHVFLLAA